MEMSEVLLKNTRCNSASDPIQCLRSKHVDELIWGVPMMTLSLFDEGYGYVRKKIFFFHIFIKQ